ncbi:MAG: hypothetical protein QOG27_1777 [Verrucomicrobiota bacterium]
MAHPLLTITIIAMVLISLRPLAFKKIVLLAVAILGLSSVASFADSVFMARRYAPAKQWPSSGSSGLSSQDAVSSERPSVPGYGKIEKSQAEQRRSLEMEDFVITPIVNQFGSVPACVRRAQTEVSSALGDAS